MRVGIQTEWPGGGGPGGGSQNARKVAGRGLKRRRGRNENTKEVGGLARRRSF